MIAAIRLLAACIACCLATGCATAEAGNWVELKGKRIQVEVADDDAERQRGLMFRDEMADGHGMVFIHDDEQVQAYWMKNTHIPLDILYFDRGRKLVSTQHRVPPCSLGDRCPSFPSEAPALYVLELNAGVAESMGVQPGDEITFGPAMPIRQ